MAKNHTNVLIIGAGVLGCALAYSLSSSRRNYLITVIEKNNTIPGLNQSSRNAGVIHAGIYYSQEEEPLKSRLCVEGNALLYSFCRKYNVPFKKCGKLIVATNKQEEDYLNYIYKIAVKNRVPRIRKVFSKAIKEYEPNVSGTMALFVPTSGIINVDKYVEKLKTLSEKNKVKFITGEKVVDIKHENNQFIIKSDNNNYYQTDIVINCAGLYSDEIAKMINKKSPYTIIPARGEFVKYKNIGALKVNRNIYQSPYGYYSATGEKADVSLKEYLRLYKTGVLTRTVGVHITPILSDADKNIAVIGPMKTVNISKDDYITNVKPKNKFIEKIQHFFKITDKDVDYYYTGIMALEKNNKDFVIERDKEYKFFINLIGFDSPAMTSSLAIAKYVKNLIEEK